MVFKSSYLLVLLFAFASFSSNAQYKYDVGLRVSSFDLEAFQFDARYHLKSPYSILVSLTRGSSNNSVRQRNTIYEDSLVSYSSTHTRKKNYSLKAGIQRKLGFFETNVFYVGASLGVGYQTYSGWQYSGVYLIDSTVMNPNPITYTTDIFSTESNFRTRTISTELILNFGMDVLLTKRLGVNAEIGITSAYRSILKSSNSYFDQHLYVSGGLRYSFGKRT